MTDEAWGLVMEAIDLRVGAPVVVRSVDQGVIVGTLAAAAGRMVALRDATPLHSWTGCGQGTGSVYDLIAHPEAVAIRSEPVSMIVVLNVSDVVPITAERAAQLAAGPRS